MNKFWKYVVLMCMALAFGACTVPADNKPAATNTIAANTNTNAAKPATAPPTKEGLLALENKAFEAWSKKDGKFFEGFLTDTFVMFGPGGRIDKAAAIKEISENKCQIKGFTISDEQMTPVGADAAIITSKATADYTCDGKKQPDTTWSASVYVRSGDTWKAAYHNEAPVIDPKAKQPAPAKPAGPAKAAEPEAKADALTEALLAVEKSGWEAWKARDPKPVDAMFSKDFTYVSGSGRMNKADTLKLWFDSKCDVKTYSLTDAKGVSLNANAALLTFRGNATGTCDGNPLQNLWGTTVFLKEGEKWTPVFYMDTM